MSINKEFEGKSIAITGSVGSVGKALVEALMLTPAKEIVMIDNNESGLHEQFVATNHDGRCTPRLMDICDQEGLTRAFAGCDYVIHCAAFKHVPLCEHEPQTAVRNNVIGTQSVINAAMAARVKKVLFTSSDKAVNPTNVMGITKLMGERLITAANLTKSLGGTIFASTRFGNVLGSRGSVYPIFHKKIMEGKNVPLTHKEMTRFMMTQSEAAHLVLSSLLLFKGGEIFVTKMPIFNIEDFGHMMIHSFAEKAGRKIEDIKIEDIGLRPGEKLFEELTTGEEVPRTYEIEDFFVVIPGNGPHHAIYDYSEYSESGKSVDRIYDSSKEERLSIEEGIELLKKAELV
jgi:FlaA1/EpsC-like NDP-sugar epimerase